MFDIFIQLQLFHKFTQILRKEKPKKKERKEKTRLAYLIFNLLQLTLNSSLPENHYLKAYFFLFRLSFHLLSSHSLSLSLSFDLVKFVKYFVYDSARISILKKIGYKKEIVGKRCE